MKFGRFGSLLYQISPQSIHGLASTFYSTAAMPSPVVSISVKASTTELRRRIFSVPDSGLSIVPILDQWIQEGRSISKGQLKFLIDKLWSRQRCSHALEISSWMADKRDYEFTPPDAAFQLELISKVQGIQEVEKYFNSIPQKLKVPKVYSALLRCYAHANSVEKAEAVMQNMRDLGFARMVGPYNNMLTLYYKNGNIEKFGALLQEMEQNGIVHNLQTHEIQIIACAAVSDIKRMEKTLTRMESDPKVVCEWTTYYLAANKFTEVGLVEKASEMLKKSEALVTRKQISTAYRCLLMQYAAIGKKDEALRLWELYKEKVKVGNRGYKSILPSLLKFNDFEMAERIFDKWECQDLEYNNRILNFLISAYSRNGHLQKAETLVDAVISKGGRPNSWTWYYMAKGYLQNDQPQKGVEMMEKAIALYRTGWKPSMESIATCVEHLKGEGDMQKAEEFTKLLADKGIISIDVQQNFLDNITAEK